jgi:hypothetical protein
VPLTPAVICPAMARTLVILPPDTESSSLSCSSRYCDASLRVLVMIPSPSKAARTIHAGAATLAQRSRRSCELVHRRPLNQTSRDIHHTRTPNARMGRLARRQWRRSPRAGGGSKQFPRAATMPQSPPPNVTRAVAPVSHRPFISHLRGQLEIEVARFRGPGFPAKRLDHYIRERVAATHLQ